MSEKNSTEIQIKNNNSWPHFIDQLDKNRKKKKKPSLARE